MKYVYIVFKNVHDYEYGTGIPTIMDIYDSEEKAEANKDFSEWVESREVK